MANVLRYPGVYVDTIAIGNVVIITSDFFSTDGRVAISGPTKQEEKAVGDCVRKGCSKLGARGTSKRSICESCFDEWCRLPGHDEAFPAFLDTPPCTYFLGNAGVPIPRAVISRIIGDHLSWIGDDELLLDGITTDTSMCGTSKDRLGMDLIRIVVGKISGGYEHTDVDWLFVPRKGSLHIRRTVLQEYLNDFAKHCLPLKNIIVRDYFYRNQG